LSLSGFRSRDLHPVALGADQTFQMEHCEAANPPLDTRLGGTDEQIQPKPDDRQERGHPNPESPRGRISKAPTPIGRCMGDSGNPDQRGQESNHVTNDNEHCHQHLQRMLSKNKAP